MKKNFNKTLDDVQGGFSLSSDITKCNFFQATPGGKGGGRARLLTKALG